MPIKDYTTVISAHTTIGQISTLLAKGGSRRTIVDNDEEGNPCALLFFLGKDNPVMYSLPCNANGVLRTLERDGAPGKYRTIEHARRVAWRVIYHWVDAQLAIIDAGQAQMAEVFLPYAVVKDNKTLYQHLTTGGAGTFTKMLKDPAQP